MTIDDLLLKKEFRIRELLRVNHVKGSGLEGIKNGYQKLGDKFLMKAIDALKDESNDFSNWGPLVETPEGVFDGSVQLTGTSIDASIQPVFVNPTTTNKNSSGGVFGFLGQLLGAVGATGETVAKFKQNITGTNTPGTPLAVKYDITGSASKTILYLTGAAILVIVVILIIKNKKK